MTRFFAILATVLAFTLKPAPSEAADLLETASTSGSFKTFLAAAKAAGFTNTLKNEGPYTVFAPTDSAFEKLPPGTVNTLFKDKTKLTQLLSNHIIPGKVTVHEVKPGKVQTIQGGMITLTNDNGKVTIENANVTQSDLIADNGVIHEIDAVVIPE